MRVRIVIVICPGGGGGAVGDGVGVGQAEATELKLRGVPVRLKVLFSTLTVTLCGSPSLIRSGTGKKKP